MRATGIQWTFAPTLANPQNELWGRTYEGFGEDVDIVAELGTEVLGKMPINPLYAEAADKGAFHAVENEYLDKAVEKIVG